MNIMVISDDHGRSGFSKAFSMAEKEFGRVDAVIHAGDTQQNDNSYYSSVCGCPFYVVKGNNDFGRLPEELNIELGGKKIFVTHGHRYGVYMGLQTLCYAGLERNADIIIYGHTHQANHQNWMDMDIINPGSLTGIRAACGSYVMLNIDKEVKVSFRYLEG